MTRILRCDPSSISFSHNDAVISSQETSDALQVASHHLVKDRHTVVFPTETVYGLGAVANDAMASAQIFSIKGRPPDNPLIVHVSSEQMLLSLLPPNYILPISYQFLIKHLWPGALTLLFPRDPTKIPDNITAGQPTVAIRMPSHPVARALIAISGLPLAAPSANSSGKPSPTRAEHVLADLNGKVELILDGGFCNVGLESTVVDGLHADGNIRVLRPGGVTVEDIKRVLEQNFGHEATPQVLVHRRDFADRVIEQTPTTPGMKYRHYSPSVPVKLLRRVSNMPSESGAVTPSTLLRNLKSFLTSRVPLKAGLLIPSGSSIVDVLKRDTDIQWHLYAIGPSLTEFAQRLFDGLLTLEKEGVDVILVEEVPEQCEGLAIMNRLNKAADETYWITHPV